MKWWEILREIQDFFGEVWDTIMDMYDDLTNR